MNDSITVADNNLLDLPQFTVGAWVMPTVIRTGEQTLLDKGTNYRLFISPGGMTATLSFQAPCGTWRTVASPAPLMQNLWNHVMATYDGTTTGRRPACTSTATSRANWPSAAQRARTRRRCA